MLDDLARFPAGDALARRAEAAGAFLIVRAQVRRTLRVTVQGGRAEEIAATSLRGVGLQVLTGDGYCALGSRDGLDPDAAQAVLGRVLAAAEGGARLGLERTPLPSFERGEGRAVPRETASHAAPDPAAVAASLAALEREIAAEIPGGTVRLGWSSDLDAWRILRSDGTDVLFAMPRCVLRAAATSGGSVRHSVGAAVSRPSAALLDEGGTVEAFLRRARAAARLAAALPDAPVHPAGSFPLVIDYALAKGLAHEAFGHASEADGFRASILARDGRFRAGDRVGPERVTIVDEPVPGDHAWQPFGANGSPRLRAVIVDRGVLADGLADAWSAGPGGVRSTGAERAEAYSSPALPRMSNIRIEVEGALPAYGTFEDHGPLEVRDLLSAAGVFRRHPRVVFLSGYAGGQVNTASGEFVFHPKALYVLSEDAPGAVLHRPAIFSGSMFGALGAIREAFGPLRLDALGTCGKGGQSVPSSGGSHWFLVLDPDPTVRLGGSAA